MVGFRGQHCVAGSFLQPFCGSFTRMQISSLHLLNHLTSLLRLPHWIQYPCTKALLALAFEHIPSAFSLLFTSSVPVTHLKHLIFPPESPPTYSHPLCITWLPCFLCFPSAILRASGGQDPPGSYICVFNAASCCGPYT